jgi:hypothetical protein
MKSRMSHKAQRRMICAATAMLGMLGTGIGAAQAPAQSGAAQGAVRTINNPGGGKIFIGAIAGQPTPQVALGKTLHAVSVLCGDRPQLGKLVQNPSGVILAGFFTVTGKKQDGKPMAGLAIAYAPKAGAAGGAVLLDYADRFPTTVNSMFVTLKQTLGAAPAGSTATPASTAAPGSAGSGTSGASSASASSGTAAATAPSGPAQPLQRAVFPDGTGVIGLPAGWQMQQAHMGDVMATGPHGEKLRFGWTIAIIDPSNPQSRTLMGNSRGAAPGKFVSIPYGNDPASAYKSAISQLAAKAGKPAPEIDVANVQDIPMQGGKNYFLYGDIDVHDGQGKQFLVAQMITTMPQQLGTWQMTVYQVYGPQQTMAQERNTIGAIFPSYSRDSNRVNSMVNSQISQSIAQENQFIGTVQRDMDSSDRMTAGMSNILRDQTVVVDTQNGGHATTSDGLAGMLIDANPNRFQAVPTSDYIKGIDY